MKSLHPFPARMAPELALEPINKLKPQSTVMDPMAGSGTVLRQAALAGHNAIGFDMDPLAVLMSSVSTSHCNIDKIEELADRVIKKAMSLDGRVIHLSWIDTDKETSDFIQYWFAPPQRLALRKLAKILVDDKGIKAHRLERNVLLLAMSRIIVTKEKGASLARDTSHSRPHKVKTDNDFKVFSEFTKSTIRLKRLLSDQALPGSVKIEIGDARKIKKIKDGSIDSVITSPPYLNAIDYLRGHRLSLVWMGYSVSQIRVIRSNSIGAEKGPDNDEKAIIIKAIVDDMGKIDDLSRRHQKMIERYAYDLYTMIGEVSRVLRKKGLATFVVGNSCLRGTFIKNSDAIIKAAKLKGLNLIEETERNLPASSRYLPIPDDEKNALSKRIRTESVLTFEQCVA